MMEEDGGEVKVSLGLKALKYRSDFVYVAARRRAELETGEIDS